MELRWVPLDEAVAWVQDGTVDNAIAVAAILHLAVGTQRELTEDFPFASALAERRSDKVAEGEDMKSLG